MFNDPLISASVIINFIIAADNVNETVGKELMDIRRQLADTKYEKEKYNNSNKELREHVKQIESERREQGRTLEELYQKIAGQLIPLLYLRMCDTHMPRFNSQIHDKRKKYPHLALENAKTTADVERTRLQAQVHDMERDALQLQHQLRFTQDELQKCHENNAQAQNEKKELQAKLLNETEERERVQLQLHQMREQVRNGPIAIFFILHARISEE